MDNFTLKFWNGSYYATVRFPDGTSQELKSTEDLTYTQWMEKIDKAWAASQIPPVVETCLYPQCVAKECPKGIK
jgi:hypothetical protein